MKRPIRFRALSFIYQGQLLFLIIIYDRKKKSILFKGERKYANKKIEKTEATRLIEQLNQLISNDEIYKNPNLKLFDVATRLNILTHKLAQLSNDNTGKNFTVFINEFKAAKAKELIRANGRIKLKALGNDCGFNSKSTFYSAFKRRFLALHRPNSRKVFPKIFVIPLPIYKSVL